MQDAEEIRSLIGKPREKALARRTRSLESLQAKKRSNEEKKKSSNDLWLRQGT